MKTKSTIFFFFLTIALFAQDNVVKTNLWSAIFMQNFNVGYERVLKDRMSGVVNVNFMPPGQPFVVRKMAEVVSDSAGASSSLGNLAVSGFSIAPEVRFYLGGSNGAPRGFYLAPFLKYYTNKATYSFDLEYEDPAAANATQIALVELEGKLSSFGFGGQIGWQWIIKDLVCIDWWLLGPTVYSSNMSLSFAFPNSGLSQSELEEVERELSENLDSAPIPLTSEVDGPKITIAGKSLLAGIRTGLSVGITF